MSSPAYKKVPKKMYNIDTDQTPNILDGDVDVQHQVDTRCGFWICKTAWMQSLANVGVFTTFFSFACLMSQTTMEYVNSQVTTLERQFGFSSKQTGIILAANDIGYLVCVLLAAHIASRIHIPRGLGLATIMFGLSGIACSFPHFLFGARNIDHSAEVDNSTASERIQQLALFGRLCDPGNASMDPCEISAAQTTPDRTALVGSDKIAGVSLVIIVLGMALQGFGKGPKYSFLVTFVDDNTSRANTGFYLGMAGATNQLGSAVAFMLGGVFSRMYVTLEATKLTPRHPKWIGAWWLGFVVFGVLALLASVPLFCFPRKLPRNQVKDVGHEDGKTSGNSAAMNKPLKHQALPESNPGNSVASHTAPVSRRLKLKSIMNFFREFLATLYRLLTNPMYTCMVVSACFLFFANAGTMAFSPKYLERMFHLPTHTANYITAGITLSTALTGTITGAVLSRYLKMTALSSSQFTLIFLGVCLLAQLLTLIFQCEQPAVFNWPSENNSCISGCGCRANSYFPVCGGDGRTYYSPCHAGCPEVEHEVYQNCTCVPGGLAKRGTCDYGCSQLYGYLVMAGLRMLSMMLTLVPALVVYIRCVPDTDKAMALAVLPFMSSLLGWLLAPIVFGNFIDSTCRIWDITCHGTGRCLLYDNSQFRLKLHGYGALSLACSLLFYLFSYLYARWTRCLVEAATEINIQDTTEMQPVVKNGPRV